MGRPTALLGVRIPQCIFSWVWDLAIKQRGSQVERGGARDMNRLLSFTDGRGPGNPRGVEEGGPFS